MNEIHKLTEYLRELPGIGPRQAKRLAYYLVRRSDEYPQKLAESIRGARTNIITCPRCQRLFNKSNKTLCDICSSEREHTLMIVPTDTDLDHIERTGTYHGYYFVIGGTVPILEKEPERRIRINKLRAIIESNTYENLEEIILAFNANPEGDNTIDYIKSNISTITPNTVTISTLGRGLSTGSELEYADKTTLGSALQARVKETRTPSDNKEDANDIFDF